MKRDLFPRRGVANGGSGIGEVTEFAMDTKWRLMRCRLQLAGEPKPIAFTSVKSVNSAAAKVL